MTLVRVTNDQCRNSLMAVKRQNFDVDPDSAERQDKRRQMRLKFNRVSPSQFMKFLESGKEEVKAGVSSSIAYWIMPKTTPPKGLPPKIKAAEVAEDAEHAPQEVDRNE